MSWPEYAILGSKIVRASKSLQCSADKQTRATMIESAPTKIPPYQP